MRHFRLSLLLASALLASSAAAVAQESVRAAIEEGNKKFIAAFAKGDAAAIADMYSSGAIAYPPNADIVKGREGLMKLWKGAMDMGVKTVSLTLAEAEGYGDTAHEIGNYEMRGDGGKVIDRGKYIVIWKREKGQWKLHRDIWNSSMPMGK